MTLSLSELTDYADYDQLFGMKTMQTGQEYKRVSSFKSNTTQSCLDYEHVNNVISKFTNAEHGQKENFHGEKPECSYSLFLCRLRTTTTESIYTVAVGRRPVYDGTIMNNLSFMWQNRTITMKLGDRFDFFSIIPYCFFGIVVVGIFLNAITLGKLRTARKHSSTTRLSLQLLSAMAVADTLCLIAQLFMVATSYFHLSSVVMTILCKVGEFVIHAASAFSVWCWLLQSVVRYAAIYFPYLHLKYADDMTTLVAAMAGAMSLLESWILVVVQYDSQHGLCKEELDPAIIKPVHLFEIFWSYFFPVILISVCDGRVAFCGTSAKFVTLSETDGQISSAGVGMNMSTSDTHSVTRRTSKLSSGRNLKFLRRCMVIALADLFMNLPSYTLRLLMILAGPQLSEMTNWKILNIVEAVAQLLYFGQFSCTVFYLAYVIYGMPPERAERAASTSLKENTAKRALKSQRSSRLTY